MSKLYRVIDNEDVEELGVNIGDICTLDDHESHGTAWFHNDDWLHDGTWCLSLTQVEEVLEEK